MKHVTSIFIGCVFFFSVCAVSVHAGSLQDDYKEIEAKRASLETLRNQYANQLKALSLRQHHLTLSMYKCITQKPDRSWEEILNDAQMITASLEKQRQDVIRIRVETDKVRQEFENVRIAIEQRHRIKTEGSGYEKEFRRYMSDLKEQYFKRLENDLFINYDSYFLQIEKYLLFLENTIQVCK